MKRHLALFVFIFLTCTTAAHADLSFGVVPTASSMICSETQARNFGRYLEGQLNQPVTVRIFQNEQTLQQALKDYGEVDLAILRLDEGPTANSAREASTGQPDLIVMRPGLDSALMARIQTILTDMHLNPQGARILSDFGIQRFSPPGTDTMAEAQQAAAQAPPLPISAPPSATQPAPATAPRKAPLAAATPAPEYTPFTHAPAPRVSRPARSSRPAPKTGQGKSLTFGTATGPGAPFTTEQAATSFARILEARLGRSVSVRTFDDEKTLHDWISRFRMVDIALFSDPYLKRQPAGEFETLTSGASLTDGLATGQVVARQGLSSTKLNTLRSSLGLAEIVTAPPRRVPPTAAPYATPARPSRKLPTRARVSAPKAKGAMILGVVTGAGKDFSNQEQAERFARILADKFGAEVDVRAYNDQQTLHQWLSRYRMVDIGLFDQDYLKRQPAGEFEPLMPAAHLGSPGRGEFVARQGLDAAKLDAIRSALQAMPADPRTTSLFRAAKVAPAPAPAPVTPPAPVAPKVAPPAPKPAVVPEVTKPAPVPVVTAPAKPAAPAPRPAPVEPPKPAPKTVKVEPPKPAVPPKPAPPVAPKPPAAITAKPIYVAPFTTVMVPDTVAEALFDRFVDALGQGAIGGQYEFIILKDGLDSVSSSWLKEHNYIAGEIFGYVEDSDCCSTDIRTKSRVYLFNKGEMDPVLEYSYPFKAFFDHDYSSLDKERHKLSELIAEELAAQVRKALQG